MKKGFAILFLLSFAMLILGCETVKGAANGIKEDTRNTCRNMGNFFAGTDGCVKKTDNWIRKNVW